MKWRLRIQGGGRRRRRTRRRRRKFPICEKHRSSAPSGPLPKREGGKGEGGKEMMKGRGKGRRRGSGGEERRMEWIKGGMLTAAREKK